MMGVSLGLPIDHGCLHSGGVENTNNASTEMPPLLSQSSYPTRQRFERFMDFFFRSHSPGKEQENTSIYESMKVS